MKIQAYCISSSPKLEDLNGDETADDATFPDTSLRGGKSPLGSSPDSMRDVLDMQTPPCQSVKDISPIRFSDEPELNAFISRRQLNDEDLEDVKSDFPKGAS